MRAAAGSALLAVNVTCIVIYFLLWVRGLCAARKPAGCAVHVDMSVPCDHPGWLRPSHPPRQHASRLALGLHPRVCLQIFFVARALNNLKHLPYNGMRMANLTTRLQVGAWGPMGCYAAPHHTISAPAPVDSCPKLPRPDPHHSHGCPFADQAAWPVHHFLRAVQHHVHIW